MGINVAYIPPQAGSVAIGFAIPADRRRHVEQLLRTGRSSSRSSAFYSVRLPPRSPHGSRLGSTRAQSLRLWGAEGRVPALACVRGMPSSAPVTDRFAAWKTCTRPCARAARDSGWYSRWSAQASGGVSRYDSVSNLNRRQLSQLVNSRARSFASRALTGATAGYRLGMRMAMLLLSIAGLALLAVSCGSERAAEVEQKTVTIAEVLDEPQEYRLEQHTLVGTVRPSRASSW